MLGHSLKDKGLKAKLVVFVTMDNVSGETITELKVGVYILLPPSEADNSSLSTTKLSLSTASRTDLQRTST